MSTPTPNEAISHLAEEAAAAMCLLSMKTASSSLQSLAIPADYNSNKEDAPHNTNQLLPMSLRLMPMEVVMLPKDAKPPSPQAGLA